MDCICDKFVMVEDGEVFEMSQAAKGDPGPGVAPGGTTGQLLAKASDEDYDTEWIDQPEMDAGHVSYDSTETYSDGTVGKELGTINSALSSLESVTEIIDTASGAIASFPDGSGLPMRSLLAQIEPQQDLHGYDAPWAAGAGLNKLPKANLDDTSNLGSMTVTIADDGSITLNGTPTSNATVTVPFDSPLPAGNYTYFLFNPSTNDGISISLRDGTSSRALLSGSFQRFSIENVVQPITIAEDAYYWRFQINANTVLTNFTFKPMLCVGAVESATYQPYANECPISGWSGLSGTQAGSANLFDETANVGKWIDASGAIINSTETSAVSDKIYINSGITIAKVVCVTGSGTLLVAAYDKNDNLLLRKATPSTAVATMNPIPSGTAYIRFAKYSTAYSCCGYLNSTDVIREDFKGITPITVSWQTEAGTVYGGTVDVVTGVLTVDTEIFVLDGSQSNFIVTAYTDYSGVRWRGYESVGIANPKLWSDKFKSASPSGGALSAVWGGSSVTRMNFGLPTTVTTATEAQAWFTANPTTVVASIASPQIYQLTGQQIETLLGNNTVFVDTGSVSVTYQASIKGYIDKVLGA